MTPQSINRFLLGLAVQNLVAESLKYAEDAILQLGGRLNFIHIRLPVQDEMLDISKIKEMCIEIIQERGLEFDNEYNDKLDCHLNEGFSTAVQDIDSSMLAEYGLSINKIYEDFKDYYEKYITIYLTY